MVKFARWEFLQKILRMFIFCSNSGRHVSLRPGAKHLFDFLAKKEVGFPPPTHLFSSAIKVTYLWISSSSFIQFIESV